MKLAALLAVVAAPFLVHGGGHGRALNCNPNDAWQDRFPAWSPRGDTIAFVRQQPGCDPPAESLGFVTPGEAERTYGSDVKRTSRAPPSWAPSGLAVAYSRHFDSVGVTAPTGPVGDDGPGEFPSWAGNDIAYTIENEVRVLRLGDDSRRTVFTNYIKPSQSNGVPMWSPDRTRLALGVTDLRSGEGAIAVIDADGSGSRLVGAGQNQAVNPTWSPDGRTIAFETNRDRNFEIYSVRVDGTQLRNLTNAPGGDDRMPAWSGNTIAFISNRDRKPGQLYGFALFTLSPDGSNLQWHAEDVHPYSPPAWSPDGSKIAFASGRQCLRWGIYVFDRTTDGLRRVTNQCVFEGTLRADVIRGTAFLDFINGGPGRDRLYGLAGADRIDGDLGGDYLDGGPGRDELLGGRGNDLIKSAGGSRDVVSCGPGRDTVRADRLDRVMADCERVTRS